MFVHVRCMFGSKPYDSFSLMHISSVRSDVLPPAPHVTSAYSGPAAGMAGVGERQASGSTEKKKRKKKREKARRKATREEPPRAGLSPCVAMRALRS